LLTQFAAGGISTAWPAMTAVTNEPPPAKSKHYAFRADSLTPPSCATRKVTDHDTTNDADMVYKTVGWFSGKHWRFDGNVKVLSNR
jgi:hypothetical protein